MTNSVMASGFPKVRNSRRGLYILSHLVFFGVAIVYGYSYFQIKHYNSLIGKEQSAIAVLQTDIEVAQKDERYVKYAAAKNIVRTITAFEW